MDERKRNRVPPVFFAEETGSTNTDLRAMALRGAESGTVLFARRQSAGRGRQGRCFLSPEGGLYLSYLYRPRVGAEKLWTLTGLTATVLCGTLSAMGAADCRIKWPNDVLLEERKLAGILTETVWQGEEAAVIIGIGLNVNTRSFPAELSGIATSLSLSTGRDWPTEALSEALIADLDAALIRWEEDRGYFLPRYRALWPHEGRRVLAQGREAVAMGIGDDLSLLVAYPDGSREALRFGEVTVKGLYAEGSALEG